MARCNPLFSCVTGSAEVAILRRLLADQQGVAALEFALLLPLLTTILLATADLTQLASRSYQVQSLAQAGAAAIASLPSVPAATGTAQQWQAGSLPGKPIGSARPDWAGALQPAHPAQSASGRSSNSNAAPLASRSASQPGGLSLPAAKTPPALPDVRIADLLPLPEGASATSQLFWGCTIGESLTPVQAMACPDGTAPGAYAEVIVRATVDRIIAWPDTLLSGEVEARATVRLG